MFIENKTANLYTHIMPPTTLNLTIDIENITSDDLDEIVKLGKKTPELQEQDNETHYYTQRELENFIKSPNDIYLVAKINGKIAGYRLATYNQYLNEAYLLDLVVVPKYRKLGVARKLYERTFEILKEKGCDWVWSLVKEDNELMKVVMEKQGFNKGARFYFYSKFLT